LPRNPLRTSAGLSSLRAGSSRRFSFEQEAGADSRLIVGRPFVGDRRPHDACKKSAHIRPRIESARCAICLISFFIGEPMAHITYQVVRHDEGWAYTVNGVFSEPFPTHAEALAAARTAAAEQRVPGHTFII
jgi:hypothetical protein